MCKEQDSNQVKRVRDSENSLMKLQRFRLSLIQTLGETERI